MNNTHQPRSDDQKSSDALEREVNQVRARLNTRAHELSDRLSPGELLDQSLHMVRDHAGEFSHNLSVQIKNNPVPTIITGIGMAWMMLASKREVTHYYEPRTDYDTSDYDSDYPAAYASGYSTDYASASEDEDGPDLKARAGEALDKAGDKIRHSADRARQMKENARYRMGHASESLHDRAASLRGSAMQSRYRVRSFLEEQPIVAGGLGLALGALLGALMPPTEVEDRTMGRARDQAAEKAQSAAREQYERAKDEAREVVDSAKSAIKSNDGSSGSGNIAGENVAPRSTPGSAGYASAQQSASTNTASRQAGTNVSEPGGTSY